MEIVPHQTPPSLEGFEAVIFTSRNSIAQIPEGVAKGMVAFCVGPASTAAALAKGFDARNAGAHVEALITHLVQNMTPGAHLLHLRGADVTGDLKSALCGFGFRAQECITYTAQLRGLSEVALEAVSSGKITAITAFSPRSAKALADALSALDTRLLYGIAISAAAAEPLHRLKLASLKIAPAPNADGMRSALQDLAYSLEI